MWVSVAPGGACSRGPRSVMAMAPWFRAHEAPEKMPDRRHRPAALRLTIRSPLGASVSLLDGPCGESVRLAKPAGRDCHGRMAAAERRRAQRGDLRSVSRRDGFLPELA